MLTRVDHIDIRVTDMEEAIDFFEKLGLKVIRKTAPPRLSVEMALEGENQLIFDIRPKNGPEDDCGIMHIAFKVEGKDTIEELKTKGIEFSSENRFVKDSGRTVSNFSGFDNTKWQLTD